MDVASVINSYSHLNIFPLYSPHNQLLQMKIVLVYQKEVKLYNDKLSFDLLAQFATKEFALDANTIQLSFKDEEGDFISMISDQDIEVMKTVFQGKQYLKIYVEGSAPKPSEEIR